MSAVAPEHHPATSNHHRTRTPVEPLIDAVEAASILDPPGKLIGKRVRATVRPGPLKDALSGTWLGHAVHPLLTDVVLGAFLSATILDFLGGDDDGRARERLIEVGIVSSVPTALTGANDWADAEPTDGGVRRAGLVHAASNVTALTLYSASLVARRRGARTRGTLLGLGGAMVLTIGGYLGGHLTYRKGVGPDQTVFDPGSAEWMDAASSGDLTEGDPKRVVVGDTPVLLLRTGGELRALHDRCSHRGCSLADGEIEGDHVTCACHGSRFDLRDGSLLRGPATSPQPAFEVREHEGRIQVRLAHAD